VSQERRDRQKRNAERREVTRLRQLRSLRERRHERVPSDPQVQRVVSRLGWTDLDRLEARGCCMTIDQVAASLGISRQAVKNIEARALAKVRAAIGIEDER
jgi:DNA-directed RNA polymerase sigma subunit (sigma70/sigma32)